jgi:hypothetical protein
MKHHAYSTTSAEHTIAHLIKLHPASDRQMAIGMHSTFILLTNHVDLEHSYLLSPQGTSILPCSKLAIEVTQTHLQQVNILHCPHQTPTNKKTMGFEATMSNIRKRLTHDVQQLLFQLCTLFESRKMQQQRFIDLAPIQQAIAETQYWLDLAKPLASNTQAHSVHHSMAQSWAALLKSTDLLCSLYGAHSLHQHGCRDMHWMIFLYTQILKTKQP